MTTLEDAELKLIEKGNEEAAQTLETFETRWRYAVFPAMIAFVILSTFGFYLIYGMLQRMESMSSDISRMTNLMEKTVPVLTTDVHQLNTTISKTMPELEQHISEMSENVDSMSYSASSMAGSTKHMGQSTWELNRSISKPMRAMNKMIPWNAQTPPPQMYQAPIYQPQSY